MCAVKCSQNQTSGTCVSKYAVHKCDGEALRGEKRLVCTITFPVIPKPCWGEFLGVVTITLKILVGIVRQEGMGVAFQLNELAKVQTLFVQISQERVQVT